MDKLRKLWNKHYELITYVIAGVLTTLVDYLVYCTVFYFTGFAALSKAISWTFAVVFSFFANKIFVFKRNNWTAKVVLQELLRFASSRLGSVLVEMAVLHITVELLSLNGYMMPIITGIFVAVTNFVTTKYIAFRKKNS